MDLFASLTGVRGSFRLRSAAGGASNLIEVFPGAEWTALAGGPLARKTSAVGRRARRSLLKHLGISGLPEVPTADQNDAANAAYLAWCSVHDPSRLYFVGDPPFEDAGQLREGQIFHWARSALVDT